MGQVLRLDVPPSRLESVQIEPTSFCNLKCAGCNRTWRDARGLLSSRNMPLSTFVKVMGNLPPGGICWLNGYGEPTLNENLPEMVAVAKKTYDKVFVISNLPARDMGFYRRLEGAGLDELHVSVDSLNPDIAKLVRFGTDTKRLKERLKAVRAALSLPITINIVVSMKNLYDVPDTLAALNAIGGFTCGFADFGAFGDEEEDYGGWFTTPATKAVFNGLVERAVSKMTNLEFHNTKFKQRRRKSAADRCPRPFFDPGVTVDGLLTPCCVELHNPGHYRNTSIAEQSFAEAWASPAVQDWLRAYLSEEPAFCKECCLNPYRNEKPRASFWPLFGLGRQERAPEAR